MRFKAIKEVPKDIERWEDSEAIPKGTICETKFLIGLKPYHT